MLSLRKMGKHPGRNTVGRDWKSHSMAERRRTEVVSLVTIVLRRSTKIIRINRGRGQSRVTPLLQSAVWLRERGGREAALNVSPRFVCRKFLGAVFSFWTEISPLFFKVRQCGSLVDSSPFIRRVTSSNPAQAAM